MAAGFTFAHRAPFDPQNADEILREVPAAPGVFCLRGERDPGGAEPEPYITRAADMRRRLRRLLAPPEALDADGKPVLSKRLNLRERVHSIEWTETGSEFESVLVLYRATFAAYGAERARKRLRLYPPYVVRVTMTHAHPRVYATNRISRRALSECFGVFPSRLAAERYADAVLDLFKLRRCWEDLEVHPEHPGCAYGEMKKCLAPCKVACTAEEYGAEAEAVRAFFATRGESKLATTAAEREAASEAMDFEAAAAFHKQWERIHAAAAHADELVRPVAELRALIVQEAAHVDGSAETMEAAVYLLESGRLIGPERLSTLGVRAVREQTAVGSSLFAQPLMLAAVPLEGGDAAPISATPELTFGSEAEHVAPLTVLSPEERARLVVARLEEQAQSLGEVSAEERGDFLALFRRWYYRPEKQRAGEVFLPNPDGSWPVRRLLNGAARIVLGPAKPMQATDREGAKELKTRLLHAGREGVERAVPVLPKRSRSRKAVTPADVLSSSA